MTVVIAVDAGTTSVRALAVDEAGRPVAQRSRELTQHYPRPGWVEHDPDEIWAACVSVLAGVVTDLDGRAVAALGITNQRETVVAWDRRTGRPLHRAIVWQDRRGAARCEELDAAGLLPLVRERTGLVLDPYFSATKLEWLLREGGVEAGPDLAVGTVDSWLVWRLSGGAAHVTDPSNASRTMLYDIRAGAWDPSLCEVFSVPASALAAVGPSSGRVAVTAAGTTALGAGVAIAGIVGDQQAALLGQACTEPGEAKNTYGTGSFVLMNVGTSCPDPVDGLLTTVAWRLDGTTTYALEGAIFVTGAAIQWLRDELGVIAHASEVGPLAASVADTGGVVVVPAFAGLGSPWWDARARGTVVGLTRGSNRAHLARAVVESIAYSTRDVVDAMVRGSGRALSVLRVDGGASVMDLLLSLQADQLGVTVVRAAATETTALGAAYAAGIGAGVWSVADVRASWRADRTFEPTGDRAPADAAYARWLRAVARSRAWADD